MLRFLFRLIVLGVLVVGAGVLYAAYQWGGTDLLGGARASEAARDAARGIDRVLDDERVREARSEIAETVSQGAERAEAALGEARLTAKIKSKMALDDTIEARRLDVDTTGTVVTVRGSVDTDTQRARALQLASETEGVTKVVDEIDVTGS